MDNSESEPVELRLKIDLVSHPARAEGLSKYIAMGDNIIIIIGIFRFKF